MFFSAYAQALTQGASQPASVASGLSSAQPTAQTQGASQPASVASGLSSAQPPAQTQGASQPASVASGLASACNIFKGVHFVECNNSVWPRRSIQLRLLYIPYHYNVYQVHLLYFHIGHNIEIWLQAFLQYSQYSLSFCPSLWYRHLLHISFFISTFLIRFICHTICRISLGWYLPLKCYKLPASRGMERYFYNRQISSALAKIE